MEAEAAAEEGECVGVRTLLRVHDGEARRDQGASTLKAGRWRNGTEPCVFSPLPGYRSSPGFGRQKKNVSAEVVGGRKVALV